MSAAVVLAALAGALAGAGTVDWAAAWAAARPARGEQRRGPAGRRPALLRLLGPLGRPLARILPATLESRIAAAGLELSLADVAAAKAGATAVCALGALAIAPGLPGRLSLVAVPLGAAAGIIAPDLALRRRARVRGARMEAELADVLDLLRVAVAAGLPPGRALAEVGRRHPGELAAELRALARREALGVPRDEALATLRTRAPAHGIPALAGALARAARHGSSLEETLQGLADDARARRVRATTETAARAAPKIQLVVALVLVPSVLLLVAAALVPALAGAT